MIKQEERDFAILILRERFPLLAREGFPLLAAGKQAGKQTNLNNKEKKQPMEQVPNTGLVEKEPNEIENNPHINANDNNGARASKADNLEKEDFDRLKNGTESPPKLIKLSSGINFHIGNEQSKTEMSENLLEPEEKQRAAGTQGEALKDWELLEMPKPFCCAHCDHQTFNSTNMRRHLNSYHSIFQCEMCPYETKRTGHLRVHLESAHREVFMWFKCDKCKYTVTQKDKLESHVAVEHKAKEVFVKEPINWEGVEKIRRDLAPMSFVIAKRYTIQYRVAHVVQAFKPGFEDFSNL